MAITAARVEVSSDPAGLRLFPGLPAKGPVRRVLGPEPILMGRCIARPAIHDRAPRQVTPRVLRDPVPRDVRGSIMALQDDRLGLIADTQLPLEVLKERPMGLLARVRMGLDRPRTGQIHLLECRPQTFREGDILGRTQRGTGLLDQAGFLGRLRRLPIDGFRFAARGWGRQTRLTADEDQQGPAHEEALRSTNRRRGHIGLHGFRTGF